MADVPPAVVTLTSTVPALPAGDVAVIEVAELAVTVAEFEPKSTAVAEDRFVPVMTTWVPPAADPLIGRIEVTVGAAT